MMQDTQNHQASNTGLEENEKFDSEKLTIFDSYELKSTCGQKANFICSEQKCEKDAVICKQFCEQCQKQHQHCLDGKFTKNIFKLIDSKISLESEDWQILNQIQIKTDKIVDSLSEMTNSIKNQTKLLGLDQYDRQLAYLLLKRFKQSANKNKEAIQILEQSDDLAYKNQNFTGKIINQIFAQKSHSSEQIWVLQNIKRCKSIFQKYKQIALSYFDQIEDCILNLIIKRSEKQKIGSNQYYSNSKILNQNQQKSNIVSFEAFDKLLLKGGINGLPVQKIFNYPEYQEYKRKNLASRFVESISEKSDLIFLIQNKNKKRFGFYSPLKFKSEESGYKGKENEKQKTIIFSLDADRCILIKKPEYSLHYDFQERYIKVGMHEKQRSPNQKRNGVEITVKSYPTCLINVEEGNIGESLSKTLFENNSRIKKQLTYEYLNGGQQTFFELDIQLTKLEVYQVYRPAKQETLKTI